MVRACFHGFYFKFQSGFDESQLLRMGTANGGILLQRTDVFEQLSNGSKNAVFAAANGLNAGRV